MKFARILFVLLVLFLALGGCGDDDNSDKAATVYTAGNVWDEGKALPVYWVNQELTAELPTSEGEGYVESMLVSGTDVYTVGSNLFEGIMIAVYWKNGERTDLPTFQGNTSADNIGTGITIHDGSVYVGGGAGVAELGIALPAFWKNGELTILETISLSLGGLVNCLATEANDIYFGGFVIEQGENGLEAQPASWKNGALTVLEYPKREDAVLSQAIVYSTTVVDGDVYVAGTILYSQPDEFPDVTTLYKPVYWKNGEMTPLLDMSTEESACVSSIAVVDGKIYIAGYYYDTDDGLEKACVWVDGVLEKLSMIDPALWSTASSIKVVSDKVYVAGYTTRIIDPDQEPIPVANVPCYWVDGERTDLPLLSSTDYPSTTETRGYKLWEDSPVLSESLERESGLASAIYVIN